MRYRLAVLIASALMLTACGNDIGERPAETSAAAVTGSVQTAGTSAQTTAKTTAVSETETESIADTVTETETGDDTVTETEKLTGTQADNGVSSEDASTGEDVPETSKAAELLAKMSVREKVGQLFLLRPDGLLHDDANDHAVRQMTDDLAEVLGKYPIGGVIMMSVNVQDPGQLTALNKGLQDASSIPLFICCDEEGGTVTRIAGKPGFDVRTFSSMSSVAGESGSEGAYEVGNTVGAYLKEYGFNLDLAPVADVNTNPFNIVIGSRAFGSDPGLAADCVSRYIDGLHENGIMSCLKHFPGHGDTLADTHIGMAKTEKTWDEIRKCELIPFVQSLDKTDMVMAAHISLPKVTGEDIPATLSEEILTGKLRDELGYEGVIITDSLAMKAIDSYYTPEEACVASVIAGSDILLSPYKPWECFEEVVSAVNDGRITVQRLDESVMRILSLKEKHGLLG
ncbi:MAG: glycoside hydrolase family 3 protein [Ruminococcus sp.]|nr:glycoside hydrolase family 3 protein [Ruminococcus sp.]